MQVHFTGSHPALQPFVNGYYYIELHLGPTAPILDIHPLGYHTMAFTLNPQQVFRTKDTNYDFSLSYHGFICQHIELTPLVPSIKMVVVSFTATGASELFKVSQHQLVNQVIPIGEVIPGSRDLKLRLEDGVSCERKATDLIENWLLNQIPPSPPSSTPRTSTGPVN